jgi:tripartite-type tricarboxylate transporter receptor subunit TctC
MKRRHFAFSLTAAALGALHPFARAQGWPEKPIRLVLSQPAGSGPDAMARMVGDQLSRKWKQAIVVENRPGGQNAIGAQVAARATPDGYTFYFATAAALVTNAYLFKSLPYDPKKDFVPVGMIGKIPFALLVNANSSIRSLQDLVAYAKAHPGKLNVANEGPKTFGGMMTRMVGQSLGVQLYSVPYVSIGAAITDTIGGQTESVISDVPAVAEMVKAGKLRPIAVTTAHRVEGWEKVPSLSEVVPGFDYAGWVGVVAPAGTPAAAIERFNRDLDGVLKDKDLAIRLRTLGPITDGAGSVEEMRGFLQAEHLRWARLTHDIGIQPE